jgi:hypothetical protein
MCIGATTRSPVRTVRPAHGAFASFLPTNFGFVETRQGSMVPICGTLPPRLWFTRLTPIVEQAGLRGARLRELGST